MTTLAAWVGIDQRRAASLYLVADSRLSWGASSDKWDYGKKLFASQKHAIVAGYAGDVVFPTQVLGQFFESIDRGVVGGVTDEPEWCLELLVSAVERAAATYPATVDRSFSLLYGARHGELMNCSFVITRVNFDNGRRADLTMYAMPPTSGLVDVIGSGADFFKETYIQWQARDAGATSRAVYSAFAEHVMTGADPKSGGPPQLVGLIRKGAAKTFGVIHDGRRYFGGMEIVDSAKDIPVRWHNNLFELCDPDTLTLAENAQRQPLSLAHGKELGTLRKRVRPLP